MKDIKFINVVDKLYKKGLSERDIKEELESRYEGSDIKDKIKEAIIFIKKREANLKNIEGGKVGFFQKKKLKDVIKKGYKAIETIQDEVNIRKQLEYRGRLKQSIIDLTEIFEVYIGENEDELLLTKEQLNDLTTDKLIKLFEELLCEMETLL